MIVYRRSNPRSPEETKKFKDLLAQHLVVPTTLDIWVMNADGGNKRQVTNLNVASFAPFFTPDGKRIIFCTNYFDPDRNKQRRQPNFDLAVVNIDGTGLERVTFNDSFDGFPMFSPDGKKLVFASNRNDANPGDTNVFIADWVE
jgi:Tol biopolymer transport system component